MLGDIVKLKDFLPNTSNLYQVIAQQQIPRAQPPRLCVRTQQRDRRMFERGRDQLRAPPLVISAPIPVQHERFAVTSCLAKELLLMDGLGHQETSHPLPSVAAARREGLARCAGPNLHGVSQNLLRFDTRE